MMALYYAAEVFGTLAEAVVLFSLIEMHDEKRFKPKKQLIAKVVLCITLTLLVTAMNQVQLVSFYTTFTTMFLAIILGKILSKGGLLKNFSIALVFCLVLYVLDFFTSSLAIFFIGNNQTVLNIYKEVGWTRSLWIIGMKVLLLVCYVLYKRFYKTIQLEKSKYSRWVAVLALLGFFSVIFITDSLHAENMQEMHASILPAWGFIIGSLFFVCALFRALLLNEKKRHENELISMKNRFSEEKYENFLIAQEETARNYHDFNHQLTTLRCFLDSGKTQEALDYIIGVQGPLHTATHTFGTGKQLVDAILNVEMKKALAIEVEIKMKTMLLKEVGVKDTDLCTIISNMLDNAIEACEKIQLPEKRFIRFACQYQRNVLTIKVVNSVDKDPYIGNKNLNTTKSDKQQHGLGIKSIRMTLEKYDSTLKMEYDGTAFISMATIVCK